MKKLRKITNNNWQFVFYVFQGKPEVFVHEVDGLFGPDKILVDPDELGFVCDVETPTGARQWVVYFSQNISYGIVAHEILHLVYAALTYRGVPFTTDAEEAFTYTLQWAMNEVLKYVRVQ